jgi:hypothetical protein
MNVWRVIAVYGPLFDVHKSDLCTRSCPKIEEISVDSADKKRQKSEEVSDFLLFKHSLKAD